MNHFFLLLLMCVLGISSCGGGARIGEYMNPLDVPLADPQVLHDGTDYYLYGTSFGHRGFEVYSSRDLVHWRRDGFCFEKSEKTWAQEHFWAPEVVRKGDTYYLFYTGYNRTANVRNICVATANTPLGPFEDAATPILPDTRGFIDGHPFHDPVSGRWYLYALEENLRPPQIVAVPLAEDLLSVEGNTQSILTVSQEWERGWVEAPFIIYHNGIYYMMYSGYGFSSPDYALGYATASSPMGPWTKFEGNPVLVKTDRVSGPGHNAIIQTVDGKELFCVYHTHLSFKGGGERQVAIDRIRFVPQENGPDVLTVEGPTAIPQPLPSGAKPMRVGKSDEFEERNLDMEHWIVFGNDDAHWRLEKGALVIEAQNSDIHDKRWDGRNIFLQYAPEGNWRAETKVDFEPQRDFEQAFLIVWENQSDYLRFAHVYSGGAKLEIGQETGGEYQSFAIPNEIENTVHLAVEKRGEQYQFSVSADGEEWDTVGESYETKYAQPKIGLGAMSPVSGAMRTAQFEYFRISRIP